MHLPGKTLALLGLLAAALVGCQTESSSIPTPPGDWAAARARLVEELRTQGVRDQRVLDAITRVPRHEMVLREHLTLAYANQALPIDGGQTISQPLVVAMMSELMQLSGDERVLEIGTGSGYQAAVIAELAKEVYSIEIDEKLSASASERLQRLGYGKVHTRAGDGFYGWPEAAPFDAIIVTAGAPRIPERLVAQLAADGVLVMPLHERSGDTLIRVRKVGEEVEIERFAPVAFVPMRGAIRSPNPGSP